MEAPEQSLTRGRGALPLTVAACVLGTLVACRSSGGLGGGPSAATGGRDGGGTAGSGGDGGNGSGSATGGVGNTDAGLRDGDGAVASGGGQSGRGGANPAGATGGISSGGNSGGDSGAGGGAGCPLYGTAVGLYTDGQGPGTTISAAQARQRLLMLSPYTSWIRFYSSLSGYAGAACIAKRELGKMVALGASLGRDSAANEREVQSLIATANQGCVDIAIVGSETLLRADQTPAALVALIQRVKAAVPATVQVATADVYNRLTPDVIAAEDVVLAHIYPFWENVPPRYALAALHARYTELKTRAAGKTVVVAETGWPSGGRVDATAEIAATYLVQLASWMRAVGVATFVFSGFDEMWKTNEGAVGPLWGYLDSAGQLKPGSDRALVRCEVSPDVWAGTALIAGPGAPAIVFTTVPPRGSTSSLEGRIEHARPAEQRVAVYILVGGGWWSKPTSDIPSSTIWPDGTFQIPVVTGGNDAQATEIRAYLIPAGTAAPVATGAAALPATLASYPSAQATR